MNHKTLISVITESEVDVGLSSEAIQQMLANDGVDTLPTYMRFSLEGIVARLQQAERRLIQFHESMGKEASR